MFSFHKFYCLYEFDINQERQKNTNDLYKKNGGALGIKSFEEITINYKDEQFLQKWEELLGEAEKTVSSSYYC
ncbi:hypothetical protein [Alkalihalobacterium chitinilyticum]|uniref:Uncharacterized protein n=1 Tax=Alkalihalobacterium chitinilyticum TaxID=2980103 RepID=A0ABT5VLN5_9BACI|nr:hypothetical protein [Alkalihalobacterium chitinilyticum]MDE5416346.1 hypothetical protein [Alkalihalobacterium chitinilyticum]